MARSLSKRGVTALCGVIAFAYIAFRTMDISRCDAIELATATLLLLTGVVPLACWYIWRPSESPAFEFFCLASFPYYGLPILMGKREYCEHPAAARHHACAVVVVFIGVLLVSRYIALASGSQRMQGQVRAGRSWQRYIPKESASRFFFGLLVVWLAVEAARQFGLLVSLGAALNTVYSIGLMSGNMGTYFLWKARGERSLPRSSSLALVGLSSIGLLLSFASGFLSGGVLTMLIALLGFCQGRLHVPWVGLAACATLVAFLHIGKGDMRARFWDVRGGQGHYLTVAKVPQLYAYWIECSVERMFPTAASEIRRRDASHSVLERSNLIHILSQVVGMTPDSKPYLQGATYFHLIDQLVPRPLWPNKPAANRPNDMLSIYYGLQTERSVQFTSIGIGWLSEAWANFGWIGVTVLAVFFGRLYRWLATVVRGRSTFDILSILAVIPLGWSVKYELSLAQWLASMAQGLVAALFILFPLSRRHRPLVRR